jgi:formylglycine-generating enzyme required for sulfatase activity
MFQEAQRSAVNGRLRQDRPPSPGMAWIAGGTFRMGSDRLSRAELEAKFAANARLGGWSEAQIATALDATRSLWAGRIDLRPLRV